MLEKLWAAYDQGRLTLQGSLAKLATGNAFAAVLNPLRRANRFVYAKRPFAGPKAVLAYLSRYTHRVAISNARLIAHHGRGVAFHYKDYRVDGLAQRKVMTLSTDEFIRRFMLHILPKGFHRIRHYGLFANTGRDANLARLREIGSMPPAEASARPGQDEPAETVLPPCPCCGGRMILIEVFERGIQPRCRPPSAAVIWFDTS
jgi:Putative transposase